MKILVTVPVDEKHIEMLKEVAPNCEFRFVERENREANKDDVQWAEIILGNVPPEFIMGNKNLKWLQTNSAGVEMYMKDGILDKNTKLTNATGAYGLAISEHMLGMYLEIIKKLNLYRDAQLKEEWRTQGKVTSVYGSTVMVLGMGDIGGEFAMRCKALGAYVIGIRRKDTTVPDYADEVHLTEEIDDILPRADVVAIALPGTAQTRDMFNAQRIAKMKDGAVILNVGRGNIIETEALCDALESGKLAGAGLDVTNPEPLPKGHRLWQIPTAVVTPHISGWYHLKETHERIIRIFRDNLERFMNGEELKNNIDFSTGYRKL